MWKLQMQMQRFKRLQWHPVCMHGRHEGKREHHDYKSFIRTTRRSTLCTFANNDDHMMIIEDIIFTYIHTFTQIWPVHQTQCLPKGHNVLSTVFLTTAQLYFSQLMILKDFRRRWQQTSESHEDIFPSQVWALVSCSTNREHFQIG